MIRKSRLGAVVGGALLLTAGAQQAHASQPVFPPGISPPALTQSARPVPDDELASQMAADLGLSLAESLRRVRDQRAVSEVGELFKQELGSAYGGAWFDNDGNFALAYVGAGNRVKAEALLSRAGLARSGRVVSVKTALEDLEAAQFELDGELAGVRRQGRVSLEIDEQGNRLVARLGPETTEQDRKDLVQAQKAFRSGRGAEGPPLPPERPTPPGVLLSPLQPDDPKPQPVRRRVVAIDIAESNTTATPTACSTESCDLPFRGGVKILNGAVGESGSRMCSAGFVGTWWSGSATYFYVMTAGHCVEPGSGVFTRWRAYAPTPGSSYTIGSRGSYRFGTNPGDPSYLPTRDFGIISMDYSNYWTNTIASPGQIFMKGWPGGQNWAITGQSAGYQGEYGCRSGFASNYTCGTIASTSHTANYGGNAVSNLLRITGACPVPGDSGGVFVDGSTAIGITSGRESTSSGACVAGLFANTSDIAQWLGVQVWR